MGLIGMNTGFAHRTEPIRRAVIDRYYRQVAQRAKRHQPNAGDPAKVYECEYEKEHVSGHENLEAVMEFPSARDETSGPKNWQRPPPGIRTAETTKTAPSGQSGGDADQRGEDRELHRDATVPHHVAPATVSAMTEVRAEMAANVWQVAAAVGAVVEEGDVIAILESMKMEIPVEAPCAGTITELRVKPDDKVQEGDLIAVIS